MTLKEQFFEMLASLDESEKRQLRQALDVTPPTPDDNAQQQPEEEKPQAAASGAEQIEETPPTPPVEQDSDVGDGEEKPEEQPPECDKDIPQAYAGATKDQEQPVEAPPQVQETEEPPQIEEQPTALAPEPLTDEQGEEMPIDYQQIIDGLNAKIMALQAENASLKAKTEGAFGLTSRVTQPVPVHTLYDNDTSDIHFKK